MTTALIKRRKGVTRHGVIPISPRDVPADLEARYINQGMKSLVSRLNGLGDDKLYGVSPLDPQDVPIDLQERILNNGIFVPRSNPSGGVSPANERDVLLKTIGKDLHSIAGTLTLSNGLLGRVVTLTSTPQLILSPQYDRGYLLLNPAGTTGLTSSGTLMASQQVVGAGANTLSSEIGVANYNTMRFFLEITFDAGVGPVPFTLQSKNPVTGTYIDTQVVFNPAATSTLYASVGTLGIDTDMRMKVVVPVGTTVTFSVGYVLKDGLPGTTAGVSQTVYIGGPGVNAVSGYPILNGQEKQFWLFQNTQIWGVTAGGSLNLNIFEL